MAQGIIAKVFVDTSQFVKGMSTATKAGVTFSKEISVSAQTAARAQVAASVKTTEALQLQVAEYHKIAGAAAKGSKEQVAAARLAESAQHKLAVSMGETSVAAGRTGKGVRGLESDFGHAARGAISGSGALHGFTRSLAFASGGFLAFEGVTKFLTDSINAARDAGIAQRSLAAQMKASGESFRANREQIEKVALSYGKLGYEDDQVIASLTVLERGTGKISQAFKLEGLAIDIARAKGIDLSKASEIIAKVFGRQETALRRAVPGLEKNAHGWDLLRLAQAKMAGQGKAATTVAEQFSATLHNTEQIIGRGLLPTLNRYLTSLGDWLGKSKNQERLQKDVQKAAKDLNAAFAVLGATVKLLSGAFDDLSRAVGGTKHAIEVLAATVAAWKLSGLIAGLRNTGRAAGAEGAAGDVGLLSGRLTALRALGEIVVPVVIALEIDQLVKKPRSFLEKQFGRLGFLFSGPGEVKTQLENEINRIKKLLIEFGVLHEKARAPSGLRGPVGKPGGDFIPPGLQGALTGPDPATVAKIKRTVEQRNAFFDAMINRKESRVQDIPTLRGQIRAWEVIRGLLEQRLKVTKDITRRYMLQGEIADVNRSIRDDQKQRGQIAKDAAQAAREREKRAAEAAKAAAAAAKQAKVQRLQTKLDWDEFAYERAQDTKGMKDDIKALKVLIADTLQLIKLTGRSTALARQLYQYRKDLRAALHPPRTTTGGGGGGGGGFFPTAPGAPTAAIDLPWMRVPGGIPPPVAQPASPSGGRPIGFSSTPTYNIQAVHINGVQNVQEFEQQLEKRAQARPQTRRGPV